MLPQSAFCGGRPSKAHDALVGSLPFRPFSTTPHGGAKPTAAAVLQFCRDAATATPMIIVRRRKPPLPITCCPTRRILSHSSGALIDDPTIVHRCGGGLLLPECVRLQHLPFATCLETSDHSTEASLERCWPGRGRL